METTIYQQSPISNYLEGRGSPSSESDTSSVKNVPISAAGATFAPRGPPLSLRTRLQRILPSPPSLNKDQHTATWERFCGAVRCIAETGLSRTEDERFLEHFRYLIIASQLFANRSRPASLRSHSPLAANEVGEDHGESVRGKSSLPGVFIASVCLPFVLAWILHWSRTVQSSSTASSSLKWGFILLLAIVGIASLHVYTLRGSSRRTQRCTTNVVSGFVDQAHTFDGVTSTSLKLIQEVEIVSRGYEINQPMPPISRLEEITSFPQCLKLRKKLDEALRIVTGQCIQAHEELQGIVDQADLRQYHEIYDVSATEYTDAISMFFQRTTEPATSLTELRYANMVLLLVRKALLCDFLALPSARSRRDSRQWLIISETLQKLIESFQSVTQSVSTILMEEESREWGVGAQTAEPKRTHVRAQSSFTTSPRSEKAKAQMRRLDVVSNGVRALNAKMHVLRNEIDHLATSRENSSILAATLTKQYENIGADIRGLLTDWEQGKPTMLLNVDHCDRLSRSSSSLRSPMSPSSSLGGLTAVDEGPAEALRLLNGEDLPRQLSDVATSDEEVFEAVSLPRKRMSMMSMSREEKMARMQEDRRKRATFHQQADSNTSMLRELETVIKHRPRGRTVSRMTNF